MRSERRCVLCKYPRFASEIGGERELTTKEKNPRTAAAVTRASEETTRAAGFFDVADYNTACCGLASLIPHGAKNAATGRYLAELTGSTWREVTRQIEHLRKSGVPVCACSDGYFMPADSDELLRYVRAFDRRQRQMSKTRAGLEAALAAISGQEMIGG